VMGVEPATSDVTSRLSLTAAGFEDTEARCFWNRRCRLARRQFSRELNYASSPLAVEAPQYNLYIIGVSRFKSWGRQL
jgi:hypothetical protein